MKGKRGFQWGNTGGTCFHKSLFFYHISKAILAKSWTRIKFRFLHFASVTRFREAATCFHKSLAHPPFWSLWSPFSFLILTAETFDTKQGYYCHSLQWTVCSYNYMPRFYWLNKIYTHVEICSKVWQFMTRRQAISNYVLLYHPIIYQGFTDWTLRCRQMFERMTVPAALSHRLLNSSEETSLWCLH